MLQNVQDLRNKFKNHFTVAMLEQDVWELVSQLAERWRSGSIKGQPKGPLKQTHLMPLLAMTTEEKQETLQSLLEGSKAWTDIRKSGNKRK